MNNIVGYLKNLLKNTPFHPQWLIFRDNYQGVAKLTDYIGEKVLDIGCGHCEIKKFLPKETDYTGIDYYYTSVNWYRSAPDIFADAQNLPIRSGAINTVFFFDVLEHIPEPEQCLHEISRILGKQGKLILQTPFIYPVHDSPLDFTRWTIYGLEKMLQAEGLNIINIRYYGEPIETSLLMMNMALSKTLLNSLERKNLLLIFIPLLPFIIITLNIIAVISKFITPTDKFMPFMYRIVAEKI